MGETLNHKKKHDNTDASLILHMNGLVALTFKVPLKHVKTMGKHAEVTSCSGWYGLLKKYIYIYFGILIQNKLLKTAPMIKLTKSTEFFEYYFHKLPKIRGIGELTEWPS